MQHNRQQVYTEMLLSVVAEYHGVGNFRDLTESEIEFFYDGLRKSLQRATKPGKGKA